MKLERKPIGEVKKQWFPPPLSFSFFKRKDRGGGEREEREREINPELAHMEGPAWER